MAKRRTKKLYSLAEVSRKTGISLASLRRYRTLHADRIPSEGEGRRQRFPEAALVVFTTLKEEGMARRGRGRRTAGAPGRTVARSRATRTPSKRRGRKSAATKPGRRRRSGAGRARTGSTVADRKSLLTLVEIGQMTGISYPTLLRYVRLHLDRLPHAGSGRKRRFRPEAVAVFQDLREQSRRGRRGGPRSAAAAPSVARQLSRLERGQRELARQIRDLRKALHRPLRIKLER